MKIQTDYLIIGGGIAGTTAAETIREKDTGGIVAIITKEPHPLYSRVLLPSYIEGRIPREQVFLRTLEDYVKKGIHLYTDEEVTVLDVEKREVLTAKGNIFYYKQLLISAGGKVKKWSTIGLQDVARLHTVEDADAFREKLSYMTNPEVGLVGGGFIGLEIMAALIPRKIPVHCFIREPRYWARFLDKVGSEILETHIGNNHVTFHHEEEITALRRNEDGSVFVATTKRNTFQVGMMAVGIGIEREISVFGGVGLEVERGIKTNEFLETNIPGIWAAGDIAEYYAPLFGRHLVVGSWNNSFLQGRVAGGNMTARQVQADSKNAFLQIPLYAIDVANLHITFLGDVYDDHVQVYTGYTRFLENNFYERFFVYNNHLVGAVLVNKFEDRKNVENLIRSKADVSSFVPIFEDPLASLDAIFSL